MSYRFQLPGRPQPIFNSVKEFELTVKLGEGAFSKVYKGKHKFTESVYAVKVIDFSRLGTMDQENIEKEIIAHKEMNHKNIVRLYDFFKEENIVYLIMEYCTGGNLFNYMSKKMPMSLDNIQKFFKQTVDGVDYIHKKGFINRDIKPENILLDNHGNVKICDFGWASHKSDDSYRKLRAGTIPYMSPESLSGEYQELSSDIWSLGILLYELFNNKEPYSGMSCNDQLNKIRTRAISHRRTDIPISGKSLIQILLTPDKDKRPKIEEIYKHTYLKSYEGDQRKSLIDRPRNSIRCSPSVHSYDKLLHGTYESNPKSVSMTKPQNYSKRDNCTNLTRSSDKSSKKSISIIDERIIHKVGNFQINKLSDHHTLDSAQAQLDRMSAIAGKDKSNRYMFRGAKAIRELNITESNINISGKNKDKITTPLSPRNLSKPLNIDTKPSLAGRVCNKTASTYYKSSKETTTDNEQWVIKDYSTYKKRYHKSTIITDRRCNNSKNSSKEVRGVVGNMKRLLTPNITRTKHSSSMFVEHSVNTRSNGFINKGRVAKPQNYLEMISIQDTEMVFD